MKYICIVKWNKVESRNKSVKHSQLLFNKDVKYTQLGKIILQWMENCKSSLKIMKLGPYLSIIHKNQLKNRLKTKT